MLVGQERVGKTSLKKSLTGQRYEHHIIWTFNEDDAKLYKEKQGFKTLNTTRLLVFMKTVTSTVQGFVVVFFFLKEEYLFYYIGGRFWYIFHTIRCTFHIHPCSRYSMHDYQCLW